MNMVTGNNVSAGRDERCVFVPRGNESQNLPAAATFNFNLQPYKFAAVKAVKSNPENTRPENIADKKTEFNRFIAFGKSLALQANGLY